MLFRSQVPCLEEFVNGLGLDALPLVQDVGNFVDEKPLVLDSQRKYLMTSRLGEIVTVAGKIEEVFSGMGVDQVPHYFLNFGNWKMKCFTVVLWDEALNLMESTGMLPGDFLNKWVCVTGMLTAYRRRPQIIVNTPFDIEVLDEEKITALIEASSRGWFAKKVIPRPTFDQVSKEPAIVHRAVQKEASHEQLNLPQVDVQQSSLDLNAQVANPLDLSVEVASKINDLYQVRKPKSSHAPRKKKGQKK